MQAISYQVALHAAQELLNTPADNVLTEFAVLKQLEVSVHARIESLKPDAITEAQLKLGQQGRTSGSFLFNGHTFSLSKEVDYQIVEHPQKYTMQEGVDYRTYARMRENCKSQGKAYTKLMRAIESSMPTLYPNIEPDDTILEISVLD